MKSTSFFVLLHCVLCLVLFSGCGDNKLPLGGRVTYSDDGSPVEVQCYVCFESPAYYSRGVIKKDGRYTVGSLSEADGIPPGTYKVYIIESNPKEMTDDKGRTYTVPSFAPKFLNGETSGLTFTVDGKNKVFDFKVDRAKPEHQKAPRMP